METWNRKNFNLRKFKSKRIVIHCDTEEKAEDLMELLNRLGSVWSNYNSLISENYWHKYNHSTCYNLTNYGLGFADVGYYFKEGYEIIDWEIADEAKETLKSKTEESEPELLKFKDLEEGKIYNIVEPTLYKKENGKLKWYSEFYGFWVDCSLSPKARFIDTGKTEIKEKEVDFDKVPQGALVQVRNNGECIWKNRYFVKMHKGKYVTSTRVEDDK